MPSDQFRRRLVIVGIILSAAAVVIQGTWLTIVTAKSSEIDYAMQFASHDDIRASVFATAAELFEPEKPQEAIDARQKAAMAYVNSSYLLALQSADPSLFVTKSFALKQLSEKVTARESYMRFVDAASQLRNDLFVSIFERKDELEKWTKILTAFFVTSLVAGASIGVWAEWSKK